MCQLHKEEQNIIYAVRNDRNVVPVSCNWTYNYEADLAIVAVQVVV